MVQWPGLSSIVSKGWNILWKGYHPQQLGAREQNIQKAEALSSVSEKQNVILASGPFSEISYYSDSLFGRISSLFMKENSEYLVQWSNRDLPNNIVIQNNLEKASFEKVQSLCENQAKIYTAWSQNEAMKIQNGNPVFKTIYKIINWIRPYFGLQTYDQIATKYNEIAARFGTVAFNVNQLIRNYQFEEIKGKLIQKMPLIKTKMNSGEWPLDYAQMVVIGALEWEALLEDNSAIKDIYSNFVGVFSNPQVLNNSDPAKHIIEPIHLMPLVEGSLVRSQQSLFLNENNQPLFLQQPASVNSRSLSLNQNDQNSAIEILS